MSRVRVEPDVAKVGGDGDRIPDICISRELVLRRGELFLPITSPRGGGGPRVVQFRGTILGPFIERGASAVTRRVYLVD